LLSVGRIHALLLELQAMSLILMALLEVRVLLVEAVEY